MSRPRYSALERWAHRVAFLHRSVQLTAADLEDLVLRRPSAAERPPRPVFVTSLPRAGTTVLLEILARSPELASHCYRDMPFVMAPLLWSRLSRPFRLQAETAERAHGDGLEIGYDSPEAFEEIVWRAFWPRWYGRGTLPLWPDDARNPAFETFFERHMAKVVAVRAADGETPRRYVSKNNANVARLGLLRRLFPDGTIVVPFRDPVDQAESLRRQHVRFLQMHADDPFARRYMRDLGHLEFGDLHTPLAFSGMAEVAERHSPLGLDYWLGYWRVAFEHVLERADDLVLVSYERLCGRGPDGLSVLADRCGLESPLTDGAAGGPGLRPPRRYDVAAEALEPSTLAAARDLHDRLLERSVL